MVHSNERGRALEYVIATELESFIKGTLKLSIISTETTKRLNIRDKAYFDALDVPTQNDFILCSKTLTNWIYSEGWFSSADHITIDRFGDEKAKQADPTDIQIGISGKDGSLVLKNLSLKHHHDALKHPRLPSLAQQCGFSKGCKEDTRYRKRYEKLWLNFGNKVKKLNKKVKKYEQIDSELKYKNLYVPLMKCTNAFLLKQSKNSKSSKALFEYLVGKTNYIVIKNDKKELVVKDFSSITFPTSFSIIYPYKEKGNDPRSYFLLEFDNGWKIRVRIHNASSRIFKSNGKVFATEKMDPICINLENVITIKKIKKKLT